MNDVLFLLVLAFGVYLGLALGARRVFAKPARESALYASGEAHPTAQGAPGYRQFFAVALFFAVLHLGALVLSTSPAEAAPVALLYLLGLAAGLVALLLG